MRYNHLRAPPSPPFSSFHSFHSKADPRDSGDDIKDLFQEARNEHVLSYTFKVIHLKPYSELIKEKNPPNFQLLKFLIKGNFHHLFHS